MLETKMNRTSRRKASRNDKKIMTHFEIEKQRIVEAAKKQLIRDEEETIRKRTDNAIAVTKDLMALLFAYSLNAEFNFGHKRLWKLMERMKLQLDCIDAGELRHKDLLEWAKETNFRVTI